MIEYFQINGPHQSKFHLISAAFIFMYPLLGTIVKHWYSGFAMFIVFLGIYYFLSNLELLKIKYNLAKNEVLLCFFVLTLFLIYLLSGFVNGWNSNQLEFFAGEFNFLLFLALFVIVREVKNSVELIIKGTIISGILVFPYVIYELYSVNFVRVEGAYGHLFIGPVFVFTASLSVTSYKYFKSNMTWRILIILSTISSVLVIVYSKSGTAYIAAVLLFLLIPFIIFKKKMYKFIFIVFILLLVSSLFVMNEKARESVNRVVSSYYLYNSLDSSYKGDFGTLGNRIELWKIGLNIFKDNMFVGVGRNNFKLYVRKMHENGQVNRSIYDYSKHPHNIYVETLVSKGLIGFIVLLFIFYLLFGNYIEANKLGVKYSDVAIIHLVFILIVGVASEAPLLKNNFLTIFLLYSAAFFSFNTREIFQIKSNLNIVKPHQ